jgi:hypothetical protein
VEVVTVDELCRRVGVQPSFLKVEAEGLEEEIIAGMEHLRPRKIAVDASPEGGADAREAIVARLQVLGYVVSSDSNMVYGRWDRP